MVAKAAVHAPALDIVSGPIVPAKVADPAGVLHLRCNAKAKLAIGPKVARGDRRTESRQGSADRGEIARQTRNGAALEFVENAGRGERLPQHIIGRNSCADPHTQATKGAFDVVDC